MLEALGDVSYGLVAGAERLAALAPTVPFMVNNFARSGESLGSFYGDVVVESGTSYLAFGDYVTKASGMFTDLLLEGGKDISYFLHMHGTADVKPGPRYSWYGIGPNSANFPSAKAITNADNWAFFAALGERSKIAW